MIIISIHLQEGTFDRHIYFDDGVNLIHSARNSCGKTTLMRFILYGLGFNIPGTKKIHFGRCQVKITLYVERLGNIDLIRNADPIIELVTKDETKQFALPFQQHELHSILFGSNNKDILNNLLGCFYVDQEKGWTLLNRGVVIGSIHFNIEELIRGLSGIDCSKLISQKDQASKELIKYKAMYSVALYREQVQQENGDLSGESFDTELDSQIDQLNVEFQRIKQELKRINQTLADNKRFQNFIEELRLFVRSPEGSTFCVTKENLVGFKDATALLQAKNKILFLQQTRLQEQLRLLQIKKEEEAQQLSFFKSITPIEMFDKSVSRLPINSISTKREIDRLTKEIHNLQESITSATKRNSTVTPSMASTIIKYCTELGINTSESPISETYIFTSNLKELSGAVLHKTVFAFRLAYISEVEKLLQIRLPILLDSPSGKEVDRYNVDVMMDILKRDFSDHQIIIASIFEYDFPIIKKIEIGDRLICNLINDGIYNPDKIN